MRPIWPKLALLLSTTVDTMKTSHAIISAKPAKAHKAAGTMVSGRATLDAKVATVTTASAMETGNGTTLLVDETSIVVVLVVVVVELTQAVPVESATSGAVQLVTQILFSNRGKLVGQGLVHSVVPLLYTTR